MPTARHPEIIALDVIVEALIKLPDQIARERVLNYAKELVETKDSAVSTSLRVIADNAAD